METSGHRRQRSGKGKGEKRKGEEKKAVEGQNEGNDYLYLARQKAEMKLVYKG